MTIDTRLPNTNSRYFPRLSLIRPRIGPVTMETRPVTKKIRESCVSGMRTLFTRKALLNGMIMKPPVASSIVAMNPRR